MAENKPRRARISDVALAEEREALRIKAEGLDKIASLLAKIDALIGDVLDERSKLEEVGMSSLKVVELLGAQNINRRILRIRRDEWALEVGAQTVDTAEVTAGLSGIEETSKESPKPVKK
ncbi:MAG: hypothetical protein QM705_11125 [Ancrocorticia sp.]